MLSFTLPYPPSINHYWRTRRGSSTPYISAEGKAYRPKVAAAVGQVEASTARLALYVQVFPPDKRRRDIDNVLKALLDALKHAGLYVDDCQVDLLITQRMPAVAGGLAVVTIAERQGREWKSTTLRRLLMAVEANEAIAA